MRNTPPLSTQYGAVNQGNKHYYWLDLIRFTAAFLVLICHFRGAFLPEWSWLPAEQQTPWLFAFYSLTRLGQEAVLVFFVMSGFLVGGRTIEKMRSGVFNVRDYGIDRTVRIMLPLLSALFLFFPKQWICGEPVVWKEWFGCLFSLQGIWTGACIEPLWSLSYEVWFYILTAAVCMSLGSSRTLRYMGIALSAVCFLVFTKLSAHYLFIWVLGALSCVTMPKKGNKWVFGTSIVLLPVMIVILQLTSGGHVTSSIVNYLPTSNRHSLEVIYSLVFCVFLQQLILIEPKRKSLKAVNAVGVKLAAFSYTLYLVHVLVMRVLQHYGASRPEVVTLSGVLLFALWTAVSLVFCYAVYWCVERHTYTVKKWVKSMI